MSDAQVDPVLASVAAYSNDPKGYVQKYQHHRLELPHHFSSSLKRNAHVLDLGCGPGRDLDLFAIDGSGSFQVGDHTAGDTHDVCRCGTEVVIPRTCSGPHFVVLQQVRINEHTQLSAVTKGRHAAYEFGNLLGPPSHPFATPPVNGSAVQYLVETWRDLWILT